MHEIEKAFKEAIAKQPDNRVHFAAYSDWLEEQGGREEDVAWYRYCAKRLPRPRPSRTGKTVEWWLELPDKDPRPWEVPGYLWNWLTCKDKRLCRPGTCNYPGAPKRYVARYHPVVISAISQAVSRATSVAILDLVGAFGGWWFETRGFLCGKKIWSGDEWCDKQAGCPSVYDFWKGKFGEELFLPDALHKVDHGDAFDYFMPNGFCVCLACDGNYVYETLQTGVVK
jgi:uncharacterized protein (TIGR02996 family)